MDTVSDVRKMYELVLCRENVLEWKNELCSRPVWWSVESRPGECPFASSSPWTVGGVAGCWCKWCGASGPVAVVVGGIGNGFVKSALKVSGRYLSHHLDVSPSNKVVPFRRNNALFRPDLQQDEISRDDGHGT